jgi:hypothetical protein
VSTELDRICCQFADPDQFLGLWYVHECSGLYPSEPRPISSDWGAAGRLMEALQNMAVIGKFQLFATSQYYTVSLKQCPYAKSIEYFAHSEHFPMALALAVAELAKEAKS